MIDPAFVFAAFFVTFIMGMWLGAMLCEMGVF